MVTLAKTLTRKNASLNMIENSRRHSLTRSVRKIEIIKHRSATSDLDNMCEDETKIYVSFILRRDTKDLIYDKIDTEKVYEVVVNVQEERSCERLIFSGLRIEDMDLLNGTVIFKAADPELIRK